MLQQTRVEAVLPYYRRFLEAFPSVESLAAAPETALLAAWSGLGYYSRARNVQKTAQTIVAQGMPSTFDEILALPGIGPYTAAAVASIVFDLPHAAVDGNVIRVIARLDNDPSEITAPATRRAIAARAEQLLDRRRPGDFNQAMMELGATICTPRNPQCGICPVSTFCAARQAGTQKELPVKLRKQEVRETAVELVIVEYRGAILLVRRPADARRLAGFFELPEKKLVSAVSAEPVGGFCHQIVNDRYRIHVSFMKLSRRPDFAFGNWVLRSRLESIPLTTVTKKALALTSLQPTPVRSR